MRTTLYYSQLYYALETINNHCDGKFDIVVYYTLSEHCNDLYNYKHLNGGILVKDFPNVKFIQSDYDLQYNFILDHNKIRTHDPYMGKWYLIICLWGMFAITSIAQLALDVW